MPLLPYNSIGGYAIGFTASTVIDSNGNIFAAGISAAGATFSGLARFNAGISAAGATLSGNIGIPSGSTFTVNGNLVGATATFINGDFTLRQNSVFGITAANNIKQIVQHNVFHTGEYYSYYSTAGGAVTNQTIAILPIQNYNVIIKSLHFNVSASIYTNYISNFIISVYSTASSTVVDWTETKTFYTGVSTANVPIYNIAIVSGNIHISVSQTQPAKVGSLFYSIIAKAT